MLNPLVAGPFGLEVGADVALDGHLHLDALGDRVRDPGSLAISGLHGGGRHRRHGRAGERGCGGGNHVA